MPEKEMIAYVNGEYVPQSEAKVSIFDHGFLWGDGVYDAMVTLNGYLFKLDKRINRLFRSIHSFDINMPLRAIREQVASAIDLVVHLKRLRDGVRRVVQITEVQGLESDTIVMQDIFKFYQEGVQNGQIVGELRPCGIRPKFSERLDEAGFSLPSELFGPIELFTRRGFLR